MTGDTALGVSDAVHRSLADARPTALWTDTGAAPDPPDPVRSRTADLVIVGAGLTGLWAALLEREAHPSAEIVVLDAGVVGGGASGRNGGFISASLTHGLAHGMSMWPDEIETLVRLGNENLVACAAFVERHAIDADLRLCGVTRVATRPHEVDGLRAAAVLAERLGEDVEFLDRERMHADVHSVSYLAGLRQRSNYGLVDPAALTRGLAHVARSQEVVMHGHSPVKGVSATASGVVVRTDRAELRAARVIVATNGYPAPVRAVRRWVLPVYDYVLATEPLSDEQWSRIGWADRQGIRDSGNRFHYYRPTRDGRILFGGYDAIYHFGGRVSRQLDQRTASHQLLARHFVETFPQLEDLRFTHRWGGVIDSTTRFTPAFGTTHAGRTAWAVGYTGLGVGASRFGARVALDLVHGRDTELTRLAMVRRPPVRFPPEPFRWLGVAMTQRALARQDRNDGRRGVWLRLLDRFGIGFES